MTRSYNLEIYFMPYFVLPAKLEFVPLDTNVMYIPSKRFDAMPVSLSIGFAMF